MLVKETATWFKVDNQWEIEKAPTPKEHISEFFRPDQDRTPQIAKGCIRTILNMLCGKIDISVRGSDFLLTKDNQICFSRFNAAEGRFEWWVEDHLLMPAAMVMQSILSPEVPDVAKYFRAFIKTLPPSNTLFSEQQLTQYKNPERIGAIIQLADAVYFGLKTAEENGLITAGGEPTKSELDHFEPYDLSKHLKKTTSKEMELLKLAVNEGNTVLLMGPTGTFKTEMAKRAALEQNANLVIMKGQAEMSDRDFFEGIIPTPDGPKVVDGPVTEAFRKAQSAKTVLLLDELLRFRGDYLGAMVGALDQYSPQEIAAMGLTPPQEEVLGANSRYYCLRLPSGQKVVTPVKNLCVIATTNMGDDYVQENQIDTALFSRFNFRVMVNYPSDESILALYDQVSPRYAQMALEMDKYTRNHLFEHGGLLKRESNVRVGMNFLKLIESGIDAVVALEVTYIPECAPVDSSGRYDQACQQSMTEDLNHIMRKYGLG